MFGEALGQAARLPAGDFAEYGVTDKQLENLRARFADWRADLLAG